MRRSDSLSKEELGNPETQSFIDSISTILNLLLPEAKHDIRAKRLRAEPKCAAGIVGVIKALKKGLDLRCAFIESNLNRRHRDGDYGPFYVDFSLIFQKRGRLVFINSVTSISMS